MEIRATNTTPLTDRERQKLLAMIRKTIDIIDDNFELDDETVLKSLPGFDSLTVMRFLGQVEIEFFINLGWESLEKVKTLADLYEVVAQAKEN
ncbi:MAG: acyl carrier protein [Microcoleus sp.]